MKIDKRTIVKSRPLVMGRHQSLGVNTGRLWNYLLLQILAAEKIDPNQIFIAKADDFAVYCGVSKRAGYLALQRAAEELQHATVMVEYDVDGKLLPDGYDLIGYIQRGGYRAGRGLVEFKLNASVLKYLAGDLIRFVHLKPRYMLALITRYGPILYEHLKMNVFNKSGDVSINKPAEYKVDIHDFRDYMGVVGRYKKHNDLLSCVINKAMGDINLHTDFHVQVERQTRGIAATELFFTYWSEPPQSKYKFAGGQFGDAAPDSNAVQKMALQALKKL